MLDSPDSVATDNSLRVNRLANALDLALQSAEGPSLPEWETAE